jgi:hypothetical protein
MLPDIRFAIGAVLAGALLIVTAFGLAATVRIAHHQTVSPFESSRVLSYADPLDWSARPDALRRLADPRGNDSLLERLAAIPLDPTVITPAPAPVGPLVDRELPGEVKSPEATPPAETIALLAVPADTPAAAPVAVPDVAVETPVATPSAVVVAEMPAIQNPETTPSETERVAPERVTAERAPVERVAVERVAALPTPDEPVSKAEPEDEPLPAVATPIPPKKPVAKAKVAKKKAAKRKTARVRTAVNPPTASTGYPVTTGNRGNRGFAGFEKNFFVD